MKKNTKTLLIAILLISTTISSWGQIPFNKNSKGRIAMSSDGNFWDTDDYGATAASFALMAKAELQDKFVLYTYADHVWGSEANRLPDVRKSAFGGRDRFKFDKAKYVEAVTNPELAYNSMKDEINASSANDPLIIICAGPMEVVGIALDRAEQSKRQYVTLISHSWWNDNHSDRHESSKESSHSGWTWDDMKRSFTNVNFIKIKDQNQETSRNGGFNTEKAGPGGSRDWDSWNWMRDSNDENIKWVYSRAQAVGRPDISDCGMVWYLIHNDENGGPQKMKDYLGSSIAIGGGGNGGGNNGGGNGGGNNGGNGGGNNAVAIPGTIEAEDFDTQSGVQAETTADAGGGQNIGYIENGDSATYKVNVNSAGTYEIDARVSSGASGGKIVINADGTKVGELSVTSTGGWQTWTSVKASVNLTAGEQTLKLNFTGGSGYLLNLNKLKFTKSGTNGGGNTGGNGGGNNGGGNNGGGNGGDCVALETNGVVAVEAEHFESQSKTDKREWYVLNGSGASTPTPDPDPSHHNGASEGGYLELLPDTRVTHGDPLVNGESFSNTPGEVSIINYKVKFTTPGKYFVWVRAYSTGSEDNGIHVGIDGNWPASGARMQWCTGKNQWTWESKQRTDAVHCGEAEKIFINVPSAGVHTISFSMREDGFEIDKFVLSQTYTKPTGNGPKEVLTDCTGGGNTNVVDGGSVSTNNGLTAVTTTTGDGVADLVRFKTSSNSSASYIYLITDEAGKILTTEQASHDFEGASVGICKVYGLSYEGTLQVVGKNVTASNLSSGKFSVSTNSIIITRKDMPTGGNGCNDTITATLSQDAYLQGTTRFNSGELRIESGKRISYLKFTVPAATGTVTSATLELAVSTDGGNGLIEIFRGSTSNWTEANLSNSNKPAEGTKLGALNTTYSTGQSYKWDLSGVTPGQTISLIVKQTGGNDVSFSSKEGAAAPKLTLKLDCSTSRLLAINKLNTNNLDSKNVKVFPNPVKDVVTISGVTKGDEIVIYNILGKVVTTKTSNKAEETIDMSGLNSGLYIIKVPNKVNIQLIKQ